MSKVTIQDVARSAEVSAGTVSAVLNNRSHVRPMTRDKVLSAISRLNYEPSHTARSLRLKEAPLTETKRIGVLVKEINNPFYAEVILGAREVLRDHDYVLFLTSSEGHFEQEIAMINMLRASRTDALIIAPILDDRASFSHLFRLLHDHFPFVLLGEVKGLPVSMVTVDNVKAAKMAAQHLIRDGHSHIVHFAGPKYSAQSQYRIQGFTEAFSESHLVFHENSVIRAGDHLADGYRTGKAFFENTPESEWPTAVTCFNDLVAIGVMRALFELNIPVPGRVSIVGYDDIEMARFQAVPLTTVRTSTSAMGRHAAELLLRYFEAPHTATPEKKLVEAELIIRQSTRSLLEPS